MRSIYLTLAILLLPLSASATNQFTLEFPNPLGCDSEGLFCLAEVLINALYAISIPLTIIMVIWAGFQFLTAGGNEEKISAARKTILYAAIGFGVIILSGAFSSIIQDLLGVEGGTAP
jgi:hypothetical protein